MMKITSRLHLPMQPLSMHEAIAVGKTKSWYVTIVNSIVPIAKAVTIQFHIIHPVVV